MAEVLHHYMAFGLRLVSDAPLPGFLATESGATDLQVFFRAKVPDVEQRSAFRREVPEVPGLVYETVAGADATEIRVLHESGTIRLVIKGSSASFAWSSGIDIRTVKALFSGMILKSMALWRGKFALHAGAVEIPGTGTLVVAGQKGAGKSTLLAGFYAAGARVVAEDMAVLSRGDADWHVHSGARILKLSPQAAAVLAREAGGTSAVGEWHSDHPGTADFLRNQKVLLDTTGRDGARGAESSPLAAVCLLGPRSPESAAAVLERLDKPRAVALIAQELSEVPEVLLPKEDKKAALQNVLLLVRDVPVYRLRLPNDLSRVQAVAHQLMQGTLAVR